MHITVEDDKNLVRDSANGAILNTNKKALDEYRRNRNQKLNLHSEVDKLSAKVDALTELVEKLINNIKDKQE